MFANLVFAIGFPTIHYLQFSFKYLVMHLWELCTASHHLTQAHYVTAHLSPRSKISRSLASFLLYFLCKHASQKKLKWCCKCTCKYTTYEGGK